MNMKYLDFFKYLVKKSRFGGYLFYPFPKHYLYTRDYYTIVNLSKEEESGNKIYVDSYLKNRLVHILRDALINVPWYRNNVKIDPNSINVDNVYDMINQFPYLTKKTVMDNWVDFINDRYSQYKLKTGSTEGTTGQGILIASNKREIGIHKSFHEYWMKEIGFDYIKSRTVRIGLEGLKPIESCPFGRSGNRLLISPVHLIDKWLPVIYNKIVTFSPEVIHTYPTLLNILARYINENNLPSINVRGLLLASDVFMFNHYTNFIKAFNKPKIYCTYNMSEHVVLGKAYINQAKEIISYRLDRLYAYNENRVDEYGNYEIVGTSYWNESMPLIRYCTQDFGKIDNGTIELLEGRGQSFLTTIQGNKISGISLLAFEDYVWDYIESIQLVQEKVGHLIIRIIPKSIYTDKIGEKLIRDLENKWPSLFTYEIIKVQEMEKGRSTKINSIIVRIKND